MAFESRLTKRQRNWLQFGAAAGMGVGIATMGVLRYRKAEAVAKLLRQAVRARRAKGIVAEAESAKKIAKGPAARTIGAVKGKLKDEWKRSHPSHTSIRVERQPTIPPVYPGREGGFRAEVGSAADPGGVRRIDTGNPHISGKLTGQPGRIDPEPSHMAHPNMAGKEQVLFDIHGRSDKSGTVKPGRPRNRSAEEGAWNRMEQEIRNKSGREEIFPITGPETAIAARRPRHSLSPSPGPNAIPGLKAGKKPKGQIRERMEALSAARRRVAARPGPTVTLNAQYDLHRTADGKIYSAYPRRQSVKHGPAAVEEAPLRAGLKRRRI